MKPPNTVREITIYLIGGAMGMLGMILTPIETTILQKDINVASKLCHNMSTIMTTEYTVTSIRQFNKNTASTIVVECADGEEFTYTIQDKE